MMNPPYRLAPLSMALSPLLLSLPLKYCSQPIYPYAHFQTRSWLENERHRGREKEDLLFRVVGFDEKFGEETCTVSKKKGVDLLLFAGRRNTHADINDFPKFYNAGPLWITYSES